MNHLGEYWWIPLLCCAVLAVASGIIYSTCVRKIHGLQDLSDMLRYVCNIKQKQIDSLQKLLDSRDQEIDQLRQENNKLKKSYVDDRYGSPTTTILPPAVVAYNPKVITAELTVPLNIPDRVSEGGIRIELVKRLTPEIQKCWSVATEDDVVGNVRHYRATLHVLSR